MIQSLDTKILTDYISRQLNHFFPDDKITSDKISPFVKRAFQRTEYCFSKVNVKYFFDGQNVFFNHLNTDQYAMFLYYLSNTIWVEGRDDIMAGKVYYLNKALNGFDAFYEVNLPDIFLLTHPVGTVLGRGEYGDYFVAYQRVTIGGNTDLEYPVLGKAVAMYGGSAVIGNCKIGNNCTISFGTVVMEKDIPPDVVVFGNYPDITYRHATKSAIERYFIA